MAMGDVLAAIEGLRFAIQKFGRAPDHETVLTEMEKDIQDSLFSASGTLATLLLKQEEE